MGDSIKLMLTSGRDVNKAVFASLYNAPNRSSPPKRTLEASIKPSSYERKRSHSTISAEVASSKVRLSERHFIATAKDLERDTALLQQKLDRELEGKIELARELSHLKSKNSLQEFQIEQLLIELKLLKHRDLDAARTSSVYETYRVDSPVTPTPPSTMKSSSSSPRKTRTSGGPFAAFP